MIDEYQARHALRTGQVLARQQWKAEGYTIDLAEYEDAALGALAACLHRYDPARGASFAWYAEIAIRGEVQRARVHYRTWRQGRPGRWQAAPPRAEVLRPLRVSAEGDMVLRCWLLRVVRELPPKQGTLLQALLEGRELGELAEEEGVPYATMQKRFAYLRMALKRRLASGPPPAPPARRRHRLSLASPHPDTEGHQALPQALP